MFMFRKLPLYPKLISVGDNVHLASNVWLVPHDVVHNMLNKRDGTGLHEYTGCIKIDNNVFVGSNTTILYDSYIPPNTIIGAGSLVNRKLEHGGVYAGSPVKYICSIEEFLNKRKDYQIKPVRTKEGLSEDTIILCWERFEKVKKC